MQPTAMRATTPAILSFIAMSFLSPATSSQTQPVHDPDVMESSPNVIRKIGRFGAEMVIDNEPIVERSPCRPNYPRSSVRNNETGTVFVSARINAEGFVNRVKLVETSGFRDLDRASMIGFLGCKFKPVLKDGAPVEEAWINLHYVWTLE